ncbi:MAG: hypothetical protein Tp1124SUR00d2C54018391_14 [Prokaryotic dsDNA virus sp.]|nr:MAG: hypothetical protein Tp1124SUR00d2C54018391_14 [Prokaryotic dsDNA virus sp.]|tara:strand:+ start:12317 stop:14170 length:1854 start_codon:yes stop_codon:yes gene_type:complete
MLQLPEIFERDIQGKTTHLVPLVVINNSTYLSTNKLTLDNQHYDPLIKSLGNIKESIDVKDKKFQISSVRMQLIDYNYNNEYLSDKLLSDEIMNKQIDVYYKSQSAETLDDCLNVFSGYVKSIEQNIDFINIDIEDNSEQTLDKELPIEYVPENTNIPDRYNNARIPFVYGVVDKAPCVYYDIYGTGTQMGSKYYLVTPDKFFVKQITIPYVFADDVYGEIKEDADIFDGAKSGTIYESGDKNQHMVLGNTIFFTKESVSFGNQNYSTTPIGYGFVEVETNSSLTLNNSTYTLKFLKKGNNEIEKTATTNVLAFANPEGTVHFENQTVATNINEENPVYLMVKDFSSLEGNIEMPFEKWFYGENKVYDDDYAKLEGETIINLEASKFYNSSTIVKEFKNKLFDDTKQVNYELNPVRNITAKVEEVKSGTDGDLNILPKLNFQWIDNTAEFFYMARFIKDAGTIDEPYVLQTAQEELADQYLNYGVNTKNISHNKAVIGLREFDNGEFELMKEQSGIVNYIKISSLSLRRSVILNDFLNHDIYAYTEGRVDTIDGRYTSSPQLQFELRVGTLDVPIVEQRRQTPVRRPVRKPLVKPKVKPKKRIAPKVKIKKSIKGSY